MCTDLNDSFDHSFLSLCGYSMSRRAAQSCYSDTGLTPSDLDIVEVHDCFAPNEVGGASHPGGCGQAICSDVYYLYIYPAAVIHMYMYM